MTGAIAALAETGFSWRASACHVEGSQGHSDFAATPTRAEEVFEAHLRIGSRLERLERAFDVPWMTTWQRLGASLQTTLADKSRRLAKDGLGRLVLEEGVLSTSMHEREDLEKRRIPLIRARQLMDSDVDYREDDDGAFLVFRTPDIPWAYTLKFALTPEDLFPGEQWVVAEIEAVDRPIGIGILTPDEGDFVTRAESPVTGGMMELWLHIDDPKRAGAWILQNWSHPITAPVTLRGLWVVRQAGARAA